MLLLKSFRRHQDRSMVHPWEGSHLRSLSLRARVFHPNTCIDVRLLGPCFKTGRLRPLRQHPSPKARSSIPAGRIVMRAITLPNGSYIPKPFIRPPEPMLAQTVASGTVQKHDWSPRLESGLKRFPFSNFTYFLTLFSKCFSSFDHSTCALSVSRQYLALDDIYHPFWAAFPNNSTRRRQSITRQQSSHARDSHPLCCPVPRNLGRHHPQDLSLQITTQAPEVPDFKFELLPLHSQLLRQSQLVSFPPLIDMLKFSGYPYLIRGQPLMNGDFLQWQAVHPQCERIVLVKLLQRHKHVGTNRLWISVVRWFSAMHASPHSPITNPPNISKKGLNWLLMTLEQACPSEYRKAQCAFKDSMIHWILQFTLLIAFRCVLHRCENQEIRCWKF